MYLKILNQTFGAGSNMRTNKKNKRVLSSDANASFSLIIARIVYGINWFNVAAIFPLIALEFNKDVSLLGSVSAAFFMGIGLFQIPAGIFAAKYNPRTSAIVGIIISSTAALLCGVISAASQLIWLRFIVGVGMAFFFSSAVILIAKYGKRGFPGFSIGIMNSAHSMGGIIGIFAWIIIAQMVGWRPSLILVGIQAAWAVELTFLVIYLEDLRFSVQFVGIIASLPLIFAIISAPLIGRFYDKAKDTKRVVVICGIGTS